MKWFPLAISAAMISVLILSVSCGDDDDDDVADDTDYGDEAYLPCDETSTTLSGAEVSDLLGISADDLIASTGGGFTTAAEWKGEGSPVIQDPMTGGTQLTLTIAYAGGEIREIESVPSSDTGGAEIYTECRHRLEVEVSVGVDTEDGAFAESWAGVLTQSMAEDGASLDVPMLRGEFDPDAYAGTFEIVSYEEGPPNAVTGDFYTSVVEPYLGQIELIVEYIDGETASAFNHIILAWGDAS